MKKAVIRLVSFFALHVIAVVGTGMAMHITDWKAFAMFGASLVVPILMQILSQLVATGTVTEAQVEKAVDGVIASAGGAPTKPAK